MDTAADEMTRRLPNEFLARMRTQLGGGYAAYLRAMHDVPRRALRVNTLKIAPEAFERLADFPLVPVEETPAGYLFPDGVAIGRHPLHLAGLCYVQEPSAQQPARLLGVAPGRTVLDVCAAPGGKSGQIAQLLGGKGLLIANEPVAARASALQFNLERLGVANAVVTGMYPDGLCAALRGRCDAVLVDAPCSGEGMFRREPDAAADWSVSHVIACAGRQARILEAAAIAVKPGGALVYSTCTFAPEENEAVVEAFAARHPQFCVRSMQRLYPHTFPGEGQFMALLVRAGEAPPCAGAENAAKPSGARRAAKQKRPGRPDVAADAERLAPWEAFCAEFLTRRIAERTAPLPDGRLFLLPEGDPGGLAGLRILRAGVLAGQIRNGRFLPAHALFLALRAEDFRQRAALAGKELDAFLKGETVPCDPCLSGWCAVTYADHCIGFGKAVSGTLKNHLPKGLRA